MQEKRFLLEYVELPIKSEVILDDAKDVASAVNSQQINKHRSVRVNVGDWWSVKSVIANPERPLFNYHRIAYL